MDAQDCRPPMVLTGLTLWLTLWLSSIVSVMKEWLPLPLTFGLSWQKHEPEIPVDAQDHRPPMVLTGPGPLAKKSNKVFEADLGSEMELRSAHFPPDLPAAVSKGLAKNAMADVMATPQVGSAEFLLRRTVTRWLCWERG